MTNTEALAQTATDLTAAGFYARVIRPTGASYRVVRITTSDANTVRMCEVIAAAPADRPAVTVYPSGIANQYHVKIS